jgi:hypothetical protein
VCATLYPSIIAFLLLGKNLFALHALACAKNTLWARPCCLPVCLSRFSAGVLNLHDQGERIIVPAGVLNLHDRGLFFSTDYSTCRGSLFLQVYSLCMTGVTVSKGVLNLHGLGWHQCTNDLRLNNDLGSHQCNNDRSDVA